MSDVLRPAADDALREWARRVRANREQVERLREAPESTDFYGPVAGVFKADPRRTGEPALDILRAAVVPGETWLDIGAGGGRYALPLALLAREVIAIDPSDGMLAVLRESMAENAITNVRLVQSRWPMSEPLHGDVCLIANVGYDIEDIGPFLDAMEAAAGRLCVAVLQARSPAAVAESFWPPIHGEARELLPALPEFLALQLARGRLCEVRLCERAPMTYPSFDAVLGFLRQQLFVAPGGGKEKELEMLARRQITERDGRFAASTASTPLGIVSWAPR